jgi:hypothetical protein
MLTNLLRVLFLAPPCYVFISLVKGLITVSGCTWAGGISVTSPVNSSATSMISVKRILTKDNIKRLVHVVSVKISQTKHSSPWVKTLSHMGLWQTITGGSTMVKHIVRDTRS